MVFVGVYLLYFIIVLLVIIYIKLIYKCKRGVEISFDIKKRNEKNSRIIQKVLPQPPGPLPIPILGNLPLLAKYEVPFEGFSEISNIYGGIYSLQLGTTRCVVVNNLETIKEVLNENGKFFGGRPNFERYHRIFGGDRNNSLALCDWSTLQQKRRNLARKHCSPRNNSAFYQKMNEVGCSEMEKCMEQLKGVLKPEVEVKLKPIIMETCANMFSLYMCSTRFNYDDFGFKAIVRSFDEIFWEINQGYAVDFLPWLSPFYSSHFRKIESWAKTIREFILKRVIDPRIEKLHERSEDDDDFTDALLRSLSKEENVTKNTIIFMLEDFLGGHSAIGNLVYLALGYVAKFPVVGKNIQKEIAKITNHSERKLSLYDTENMPYTMATIYEILRHSSSPIVPHVATENTEIAGYGLLKDTIVFINNYELNASDKYWHNPKKFSPERFLEKVPPQKLHKDSVLNAPHIERLRIKKHVPHFLPFSVGKRACIGQNLVRSFSFLMLTNILENYDVASDNPDLIKMYPACVALPCDTFALKLKPRMHK